MACGPGDQLGSHAGGRARRVTHALALSAHSGCDLGLAERSLDTSCDVCGVPAFLPLLDTRERAVCKGCNNPARYDTDKRLAVYDRLSSFPDRASDQGTIAVLNAVAALTSRSKRTHLIPGVTLALSDGRKCEAGVFGAHNRFVIASEIKTPLAGH